MKFLVNKSDLQSVLQRVSKFSPSRTTLPILNSIIFEKEDDSIIARGTNLEISIKHRVTGSISNDGKMVIPLKKLMEITMEMPEGSLEVQISDNNKIEIKNDFGNYSLMGNVVDEFPSWVKVENPKELKISSETLKNLINKTLYAVSRDDIKPALQGVLFKLEDKKLVVVSTDGAKLVKLNCENQNKTTFTGSIILPVRFLSVLKNHLNDEEITILIGDNHALVKTSEAEIATRIINQKYPDYDSVIPEDNDKNILIDKEKILSSVKRVLIFSNRATNQISLNFKENEIKVSTQDQENVSTGEETIPCKYLGEEFLIGFNGEYLKETIEHQNNGDIEIKMKSPVSAAIFKTKEKDNNFKMLSLLMPIRIGE